MRRPIRARIWFWKPELYWFGRKTLLPFGTGGDEFDWHTIVLGWTITGRVIIAVRPCPQTGKCAEDWAAIKSELPDLMQNENEWPVDMYGHNHIACGTCDMCRDEHAEAGR